MHFWIEVFAKKKEHARGLETSTTQFSFISDGPHVFFVIRTNNMQRKHASRLNFLQVYSRRN